MCRLLPGEKPRQRKDFGTTSYKKPGPPTPSKNGGRLSLQGNEIQPLKEHNDKTPKKVTPSRIKALFMGRPTSTSLRENSEVYCENCLSKLNNSTKLTANFRQSVFTYSSCYKLINFMLNDSDASSLSFFRSFVMSENYMPFKTFVYNKLLLHCESFSSLCMSIVHYYMFLPLL